MTWAMSSEHLQLLIAGYVLGDLEADEAAEFEQLLSEHPAIADEVTQMQKALELSFDLPDVDSPAHLRSAVLDAHSLNADRRPAKPYERVRTLYRFSGGDDNQVSPTPYRGASGKAG